MEADQLADLIAGKILETAEATAAYHGSGGRWQEWQSALAGLDRSTTEVARSPAADLSLSQLQQAPVPEIQAESSGLTVNDRGLIPGSGDLSVAASR